MSKVKFSNEWENLDLDPIVKAMASEMSVEELPNSEENHEFMIACRDEYQKRGGVHQVSMGGAANAVKRAVKASQKAQADAAAQIRGQKK